MKVRDKILYKMSSYMHVEEIELDFDLLSKLARNFGIDLFHELTFDEGKEAVDLLGAFMQSPNNDFVHELGEATNMFWNDEKEWPYLKHFIWTMKEELTSRIESCSQ